MIDVVMPTYNRAAALRVTIDSYMSQPELGLFILLDDNSSDDTPAFAQALMEQYPGRVIYHREPKKTSTPYLRNVGISLSKNEYIFMGEDDVLLPKDHFKILLEKMQEHGADIISGRRIYMRDGETMEDAQRVADRDKGPVFVMVPFEGYFERVVDKPVRVPFVHSNALMKRALFDDVLYDPWYAGNAFREELDFFLRAHDAGKILFLVPDTISYHLKNTTVNSQGGSRRKRAVYEFQVWRNSIRCFWKNREIFKKEFGVRHIVPYMFMCLIARYSYGLVRRIKWLTDKFL